MRLLILLIALSLPLAAQQDVRISPEGTAEYHLPQDARIQAGARLGNRSLVVWGSARQDATSGDIRNILRMQLLSGTSPAGPQQTLTGTAAAPYGLVSVIPLRDRFLVFWNDRRADSPGIYLSRIDTNGVILGTEMRFSDRPAVTSVPTTISAAGTPESGYVIVWYRPADSTTPRQLQTRRIAPDGTADAETTGLGPIQFYRTFPYPGLPGVFILEISNAPSRLIRNGRLDPRPIPAGHLAFPQRYLLGADTSIAIVDTAGVRFYRSIFDSIPQQRALVPSKTPYHTAISRDSLGRYQLIYPRISGGGATARFAIERVTFDGTTPQAPEILVQKSFTAEWAPGADSAEVVIADPLLQIYCNNSYELALFTEFRRDITDRTEWRTETFAYSIDSAGRFRSGSSAGQAICPAGPAIRVERIGSEALSRVELVLDGSYVTLADTLSRFQTRVAEIRPDIFERDGLLAVTWQNGAGALMRIYDQSLASMDGPDSEFESAGTPLNLPGIEALLIVLRDSSVAGGGTFDHRVRAGISVATTSGWNYSEVLDRTASRPPHIRLIDAAYDPNREELVTAFEFETGADRLIGLRTFSKEGARIRVEDKQLDIPSTDFEIVPTGNRRMLLLTPSKTYTLQDGSLVDSQAFASPAGSGYQRLLGGRVLQTTLLDSSEGFFRMRIYDLDLKTIHAQTIRIPTAEQRPVVVENPRDRSLALLFPADGIRVTHVDSTLVPIVENVRVSAIGTGARNPAGTFLDDTLQVVWEDYRNSEADIYGSWWHYSKPSAVRGGGTFSGTMTPGVTPNPAIGTAVVSIDAKRSDDARLEIVDPLGRVVLSRSIALTPGSSHHSLDLDAIPTGAYMLVVRTASGMTTTPLVVH